MILDRMTFAGACLAALLGGLHCSGMCGAMGVQLREPGRYISYQASRLLGYLTLGVLAGSVGESLKPIPGFRWIFLVVLFVQLLNLWNLIPIRVGFRFPSFRLSPLFLPFGMGVFTALLPCPWLYSFVAAAAATANPWKGLQIMGALWFGSLFWLLATRFSLALMPQSVKIQKIATSVILLISAFLWSQDQHDAHLVHDTTSNQPDHAGHHYHN